MQNNIQKPPSTELLVFAYYKGTKFKQLGRFRVSPYYNEHPELDRVFFLGFDGEKYPENKEPEVLATEQHTDSEIKTQLDNQIAGE